MKIITGFKGADNKWYINIRNARNRKTIADGAEGYTSKGNVVRAIKTNFKDGYDMVLLDDTAAFIRFEMVPHGR